MLLCDRMKQHTDGIRTKTFIEYGVCAMREHCSPHCTKPKMISPCITLPFYFPAAMWLLRMLLSAIFVIHSLPVCFCQPWLCCRRGCKCFCPYRSTLFVVSIQYDKKSLTINIPNDCISRLYSFLFCLSQQTLRANRQSAVHTKHVNPYSRYIVKKFFARISSSSFSTRYRFTSLFFSVCTTSFIFVLSVLAISGCFIRLLRIPPRLSPYLFY